MADEVEAGQPLRAGEVDRREFLKRCTLSGPVMLVVVQLVDSAPALGAVEGPGAAEGGDRKAGNDEKDQQASAYDPAAHYYGMAIDLGKCIGCGRCVEACAAENDVPAGHFRTWVERYVIQADGETLVESPGGGANGFPAVVGEKGILRSFFVPKLCNHCTNAPCVQVCPVGATFTTPDGVVLVDREYCIGCRYCIQACPYGARFLHPTTCTAEKCTFCYQRITRGLVPACVEVCPTGARVFGELRYRNSPLARFMHFSHLQVLKAHLNTEPKVYYAGLDGEVS